MILYPALDILDGKVVRLKQGDFSNTINYFDDPLEAVKYLEVQGAQYLHLVDLSGAKDPNQRQLNLLKKILSNKNIRFQIGGGVRSITDVEELLSFGADRVVIGSLAIKDVLQTLRILNQYGADRITFAIDIKFNSGHPIVMVNGWQENSSLTFFEALLPYINSPLKRILCTDISVDGMMTGPNLELYRSIIERFPQFEIQASGGISKLDDLIQLKKLGRIQSVIVGKALLNKTITISEALKIC